MLKVIGFVAAAILVAGCDGPPTNYTDVDGFKCYASNTTAIKRLEEDYVKVYETCTNNPAR